MNSHPIKYQGQIFAMVIKNQASEREVSFFTPESNPFQMGEFTRDKGYVAEPHKHVCRPFTINSVQEFVWVKQGKIRMDFYTDDGQKYESVILEVGDSCLTMKGGHAVEFLEKSTILVIKQGPYEQNKKVYFQDSPS